MKKLLISSCKHVGLGVDMAFNIFKKGPNVNNFHSSLHFLSLSKWVAGNKLSITS